MLVRSAAVDIIVIDSVAALVPKAELEGAMGDQQMGLQARLMSKALRKLTGSINKTKATMIFINQIREKIGGGNFGPQTTTAGGRALKFFSSVRMEVKRTSSVKQGEDAIGNETTVKITKNKVAPPFKEAKIQIMFGKGISTFGEVLEIACEKDIIQKSGAWFSFGDLRLGQGKENVRLKLETEEELFLEIKEKVLNALNSVTIDSDSENVERAEESIENNENVEKIEESIENNEISFKIGEEITIIK